MIKGSIGQKHVTIYNIKKVSNHDATNDDNSASAQDSKDVTKTLDFQVWTLNKYGLRNLVNILLQVEEFILGRGSGSGSESSGNNKGDHGVPTQATNKNF
ncbi:hypothetical protein HAX54_003615 [Datura stramonium]|uniref:Uncharacterized protein n=1 Tax=Datura stramonium TaxID=4076 RepID=A0ABS8T748_DATST|nr:hypothetical protein [Datura stramonium]